MSNLNFAPYASPPSSPPASAKLLPGSRSSRSPWMASGSSYQSGAGVADLETGHASSMGSTARGGYSSAAIGNTAEAYETRFGWRVDVEAALAYATPVLAIFLLLVETKNDYARFHAYQSLFVSAGLLVLHVLFLWSSFLTYVVLLVDIALLASLALRAYRGADTMERYEVPVAGPLANRWVGEE